MNNIKGFTLLEILVATSIFLILTAVALSLMLTSNEAWFTGSTSISLRQEIIKTLLTMEKELKEHERTDMAHAHPMHRSHEANQKSAPLPSMRK